MDPATGVQLLKAALGSVVSTRAAAIAFGSSSVLLALDGRLRTESLLEATGFLPGLLCVVSGCTLAVDGFVAWNRGRLEKRRAEALLDDARKRLLKLPADQKAVLKLYKDRSTSCQYFEPWHGPAISLMNQGFLYRPSIGGSTVGKGDKFPFVVQPWVWDYLNEHPDFFGVDDVKGKDVGRAGQ